MTPGSRSAAALRFCASLVLSAAVAPYAVSRATRVTVMSDGSVHTYPWLPGWVAGAAMVILFAVTLVRFTRSATVASCHKSESQTQPGLPS